MVQTVDQYVLVHRAVKELFLEQLRVIDAHPYENVDDDGRPLCGQAKTDEHVVPGMGVNEMTKKNQGADQEGARGDPGSSNFRSNKNKCVFKNCTIKVCVSCS